MEFGMNEILTIIDKVKSTELSLFEYQDMDTKIRIKGTRQDPGYRPKDKHVHSVSAKTQQSGDALNTKYAEGKTDEKSELSGQTLQDSEPAPQETRSIIASPMVGTFYTAPAEGEDPFVRIGDTVKKGQIVGIVEAMKLMNEIESEYDGIVEEILAANEQMVEYGQPLIRIREV